MGGGVVMVVNVTPHRVDVLGDRLRCWWAPWRSRHRVVARWEPSGGCARLQYADTSTTRLRIGGAEVDCISVAAAVVSGLPDPRPGVVWLVSQLVALTCGRDDVVFPMDVVRDRRGRVIGCAALGRLAVPADAGGSGLVATGR